MASLEISQIDLERGRRNVIGGAAETDEEGSVYFSDGDEGSCISQFYSTADGDDYNFNCSSEILENEGFDCSSSSSSDCSVDIENDEKNNVYLSAIERNCRICHLSLVSSSPGGCGVSIELGCSCKDDLAAAHKHCAETWFKIKGNTTCEICNSIARNIVSTTNIEVVQEAGATVAASAIETSRSRSWLNGHRFLNLILACMVFAFVTSWLFHFSIPS